MTAACQTCPNATDCPIRKQLEFELTAARNALAAVREVAAARREGRL